MYRYRYKYKRNRASPWCLMDHIGVCFFLSTKTRQYTSSCTPLATLQRAIKPRPHTTLSVKHHSPSPTLSSYLHFFLKSNSLFLPYKVRSPQESPHNSTFLKTSPMWWFPVLLIWPSPECFYSLQLHSFLHPIVCLLLYPSSALCVCILPNPKPIQTLCP